MNKEKIDLMQVVSKPLMSINSQAKNKDEILKELTTLLYNNGNITSIEDFLIDVYKREAEGETGIGDGVAIPHGKSDFVKKTAIAVAILDKEVNWESLDNGMVKVVILFAVKNNDVETTHILLLQQVAILLANEDFITALHNVKTQKEMIEVFKKFSNKERKY